MSEPWQLAADRRIVYLIAHVVGICGHKLLQSLIEEAYFDLEL
jgi:hypothetical protein